MSSRDSSAVTHRSSLWSMASRSSGYVGSGNGRPNVAPK